MLKADNIHYAHGRTPVLHGIDLRAAAGQVTAILGANGCGKTTLLKCLTGIWRPARGTVTVDGSDLGGQTPTQRACVLAYVPQQHAPAFSYQVHEFVLMGRAPHVPVLGQPSRADHEITAAALATVGVAHLASRHYTALSGGERQLVLIARSLAQRTPVMLLDEPISHLDFRNQVQVLGLLRDLCRNSGLAAVLTIHDPNLAAGYADHIILLRNGEVLAAGSVAETITAPLLSQVYGMDIDVAAGPRPWVYPRVIL